MKKIKIGLLPRILIAIVLGILFGNILNTPIVRIFVTFNNLFSQFLQFMVPLIIVGLVTPAIANVGKMAGRLLFVTTLVAYCDTLFAGFLSYFTGASIFPTIISPSNHIDSVSKFTDLSGYFTITIPPLMDVMTALVVSFTFGLCIAYLKTVTLEKLFIDVQKVVIKCIEAVILPLLPFYIFGIFLDMTSSGQVASILIVFMKIIVVIFILHVFLLLFQYIVAGAFVKKNPFKLLANMLPAYFTALGTSSSAATIPVTLKSTVKNGVSDGIAGFVVPFCATVHLSGSALKITACALAIMIMEGHAYDFSLFAEFICMLGVIMIAAPGVPGGAIMACVGILGSILGFGNNEQALMIALYITMDNFGTACNVTGDGAIAVVMNKYFKTKPKEAVA